MPWLYYQDNPESIITSDDVQFKVSFDENVGTAFLDKLIELG